MEKHTVMVKLYCNGKNTLYWEKYTGMEKHTVMGEIHCNGKNTLYLEKNTAMEKHSNEKNTL